MATETKASEWNLPSVRTSVDFRKWLREYYEYRKAQDPQFSHRVFVGLLGKKSPSFLIDVAEGRVNLGRSSVRKFVEILALNAEEGSYFEALVFFQQAKNLRKHELLDALVVRLLTLQQENKSGALPWGIALKDYRGEELPGSAHVKMRVVWALMRERERHQKIVRVLEVGEGKSLEGALDALAQDFWKSAVKNLYKLLN